jgi:hypothetical protein
MDETFTMSTGKTVHFYSALSPNGINVTVSTKLSHEEAMMFKREIRQERDVVAIFFKP